MREKLLFWYSYFSTAESNTYYKTNFFIPEIE